MSSRAQIYYPGEVLEQTEIAFEWNDLRNLTYHERVVHPRGKGVHVSGVLKVIAVKQGLLKDEDQVDDMPTVVLLGTVWEEGGVRLYARMIWQPGPVRLDDIEGSPDGRTNNLELVGWGFHDVVEEFKFTYKSNRNRKDIRAERLWMMQVMCYLKMMGLLVGRLHVLWACDDYQQPFRPKYIRYTVKFTQAELDRNWAMCLKYKQFAVREG